MVTATRRAGAVTKFEYALVDFSGISAAEKVARGGVSSRPDAWAHQGGHWRKIYGIAAWPARHGILSPLGGAGSERRQPASRALQVRVGGRFHPVFSAHSGLRRPFTTEERIPHSKSAPWPPCGKVRSGLATDGDPVLCLLPIWLDIPDKILCHSAHPNLPDIRLSLRPRFRVT